MLIFDWLSSVGVGTVTESYKLLMFWKVVLVADGSEMIKNVTGNCRLSETLRWY